MFLSHSLVSVAHMGCTGSRHVSDHRGRNLGTWMEAGRLRCTAVDLVIITCSSVSLFGPLHIFNVWLLAWLKQERDRYILSVHDERFHRAQSPRICVLGRAVATAT